MQTPTSGPEHSGRGPEPLIACPCWSRLQHHADAIAEHAGRVAGLGWPASETACRAALELKDLAERLRAGCPLQEGAHPDAACRRGAA